MEIYVTITKNEMVSTHSSLDDAIKALQFRSQTESLDFVECFDGITIGIPFRWSTDVGSITRTILGELY